MKILQVNVVYGRGSTGKIVKDIHEELLKNKHESYVVFGRRSEVKSEKVKKLSSELIMKIQSLYSKVSGYVYGGAFYSTKKFMRIVKKIKPDIVHLHCINGYMLNIYKTLDFLKQNNIRTIITQHAEFFYTSGCSYSHECNKWQTGCGNCPELNRERPKTWFFDKSDQEWKFMRDAFSDFNNLKMVSVSEWVMNRALSSPFLKDKIHTVIHNGLDTNIFHYRESDLRKRLDISNDKRIVLHVTPDFSLPIKGGHFVIELAELLSDRSDIIFIIIGKNIPSFENDNIISIGSIANSKELANYYSISDLTLLTSRRETFSMVTAESLSCGTSVLGFKAGGPETIAIKDYSYFVNYGDVISLKEKLEELIGKTQSLSKIEISKKAIKKYSREDMVDKYLKIYQELL